VTKSNDLERIPVAMDVIIFESGGALGPVPILNKACTVKNRQCGVCQRAWGTPFFRPSAGHLSNLQIVNHFRYMGMAVFQQVQQPKAERQQKQPSGDKEEQNK
jgi:hypothetical protein